MIDAELRQAVLANFPPGPSLAVVAHRESGYPDLLHARGDGAPFLPLEASLPAPGSLGRVEHVLLEGVDDVADPIELLRAVKTAAGAARLFVVVSNAAYVRGLLAFFNGAALARAHPLVQSEIEPMLNAAGWRVLAINPIPDESIPAAQTLPFELTSATMCVTITDAAMLERARVRAYIAIADRE
ncbi:MAG: hypothetical protein ACREML_09585 [Vulcanimicrobiaceae bacterium]